MPAINPNGQESYWFEGQPFGGLSNSALTGVETFWFEGQPVQFLYPTSANKGILWALLMDF